MNASREICHQIALHFVQDKTTRFDLAIECGNLDVALEMAKSIDREDTWSRLGQQALKQGNHKVREREDKFANSEKNAEPEGLFLIPDLLDCRDRVPTYQEL